MKIYSIPSSSPVNTSENHAVGPQQTKKELSLTASQRDLYDLDCVVTEGKSAPHQQGPSWPHQCNTDGCGGTGTHGHSCGGSCQGC